MSAQLIPDSSPDLVMRSCIQKVATGPEFSKNRIANPDIGWGYVDQKPSCPCLHGLAEQRSRIVKRPVLTTVENLTGPVRGRQKTHLMVGYVHKAYPPVYARLARQAGFDSAAIIRGVEGGVIPSMKQPAPVFCYHDAGKESRLDFDPRSIGIDQPTRAVPIPEVTPLAGTQGDVIATTVDIDAATRTAAAAGMAALGGKAGPVRDSLVYAATIVLSQQVAVGHSSKPPMPRARPSIRETH